MKLIISGIVADRFEVESGVLEEVDVLGFLSGVLFLDDIVFLVEF